MMPDACAVRPRLSVQLARYRFHWLVTTPLGLPDYAGSTLRGVFGRALRDLVCVMRAPECSNCRLVARCFYAAFFEPQRAASLQPRGHNPVPAVSGYAIEPSTATRRWYKPGDSFEFDMVVMLHQALSQLPLIIEAWQRAFAAGVGERNGRARLQRVEHLAPASARSVVYQTGLNKLLPHDTEVCVPEFDRSLDVHLSLLTPLRLEQRDRLVGPRELTPPVFFRHLIRRVSFHVNGRHGEIFSLEAIHRLNALADGVGEGARDLRWVDWTRFSSRQKQKMTLGGVIGTWLLTAVHPDLLSLLYLGEWLHVGKECVFGLGRYRWSPASATN